MSELKNALRAVEKARSARDDARAAMLRHIERQRRTEIETGTWATIDAKTTALAQAVDDGRLALRQAEAELSLHAPSFIATLANDRVKLFRVALKAIADLEAAHVAEARLQAEHGWCRLPGMIGELPDVLRFTRQRLEHAIAEIESASTRRAA